MKIILRLIVFLLAVAVLAALLLYGFRTRRESRVEQENTSRESERLTVSVGHATPSVPGTVATFPANAEALIATPIYARTSGYLKKWYVDIGTPVQAGQLLAEIETPEVDQQLKQAEANVKSMQATVDLDKTTAQRYQDLLKSDGVSKQEVDQAVGTMRADEGKLAAAIADVNRLKELETFKQVRAPFAGNIYSRTTDTGALIAAGPTAVLFRLADTSTLRVFTNVTEEFAHKIKVGMTGTIEVPADPGHKFVGTVTRTAGTLDPATRTLLTEVQVPNPKHELTTGSFCQVTFRLSAPSSSLIVQASALLFRAAGTQIAVVDDSGKVHMHAVKLGRDFGRTVEVLSGITADDTIILNPADSIGDGTLVNAAPAEKAQ